MDAKIEKEIEALERFRDNALRMRCTEKAMECQSEIDRLAMESRNKSNEVKDVKQ